MLQRLASGTAPKNKFGGKGIRTLVLTPTRELAAQVEENLRGYAKYLDITSTVIFGGVGMKPQIARIEKGVDVLVATPGRLLDLAGQGFMDLSTVEMLILDEADRMLDKGRNMLTSTQPSISRLLAQMQTGADLKLFDMHKGRLRPTAEARELFSTVQQHFVGRRGRSRYSSDAARRACGP